MKLTGPLPSKIKEGAGILEMQPQWKKGNLSIYIERSYEESHEESRSKMHRTQYSLCADVVFGFCLIIYYFLLVKIIIMRRRSYLGLRTRRGRITGKEYLTKNWCRRRGSLIISRLQAREKKKKMPQIQSFLLLLLLLLAMETFFKPATAKTLRIGVPGDSPWPKYVEVKCNETSNKCFDGFSIQLFKLILKGLRFNKPYQFILYNGSYDSLVEQVSSKVNQHQHLPFVCIH